MFDFIELEMPLRRQEIRRFLEHEDKVKEAMAAQVEQNAQPVSTLARFLLSSQKATLARA
ncbi:MAG: hypothetical protein NTZ05_10400 [Chloroflexi bacterium]|nr:hypothetical protein [Chloroflexota bacterium]